MASNPAIQTMQYDALNKSVGVTYLLWFFTGAFGGHRFYSKNTSQLVAGCHLAIESRASSGVHTIYLLDFIEFNNV